MAFSRGEFWCQARGVATLKTAQNTGKAKKKLFMPYLAILLTLGVMACSKTAGIVSCF